MKAGEDVVRGVAAFAVWVARFAAVLAAAFSGWDMVSGCE